MRTKHHAIVYEGDRDAGCATARVYIEGVLGLTVERNPDIEWCERERYAIEDARVLKDRASHLPLGGTQVFVIVADGFSREAQNALLKLLEEPVQGTHIILVVPSIEVLLPTVRSRVAYGGRVYGKLCEESLAQEFLASTPAKRLLLVERIIGDKDRVRARAFLDALEQGLCVKGVNSSAQELREVVFVRQYLSDRSSSLKMLLEHLALVL